ncbi:unnamed protein product [Phytophthora fragariaefolia]|uniref:Unnamed protein product n=1 Tax=Phytophthora fragariaefolia TaxID=1490495 RepID=A0A9W6XLM0_9STRA|nr:unnamed protein product [Phytophthora fragariaefolia]
MTVGRLMMVTLGYSTDGLLVSALEKQTEYGLPTRKNVSPSPLMRAQQLREVSCYDEGAADGRPCAISVTDDSFELRAFVPNTKYAEKNAELVHDSLLSAIEDASRRGLRGETLNRLKTSLEQHKTDFCVIFGLYPPVDVPPLRVQLKPHATPVRCSARRYAPLERAFMDADLAELEDLELVYRSYSSRWASAPRIVPKPPPSDFRMCIDSRVVNDQTIAKVFFIYDWFRGYWQLPLHPDSQEIFTFMTHRGMYTPTRVPMGVKDAVAYCQSVVELIFADRLYRGVLVWLDAILGYTESTEVHMVLLEEVLQRCAKFGLKLNPAKYQFFVKEVKWCGKVISADGVTHTSERVQGLVDLASPTTAAELQQFVCAINWMRGTGKVSLASVGWGKQEEDCLAQVKSKIRGIVPIAHPKADWDLVLVADASLDHWAPVLTQPPPEDASKPLLELRYQPLEFLSGHFRGSSHRWPIIEKEAFALVESCKSLEYLLLDHEDSVY